MKKLIKGVKYGAQLAHTTGKLAKRVTNPHNAAKMVGNAALGKGVVLPGSKYIGPGNSMKKGKPTTKADADAYQHDIDYDNYIKSGQKSSKVYTRYSDADDRLRKKSAKNMHKDPNALAAWAGMSAKHLLHKSGLVGRVRDKDVYGAGGKPKTPSEYQKDSDSYQKSFHQKE
jgi:hypothetical protein